MDPLKLLSRSTTLGNTKKQTASNTPSSGQNAPPQLFSRHCVAQNGRKRKYEHDAPSIADGVAGEIDFFQNASANRPTPRDGLDKPNQSLDTARSTGGTAEIRLTASTLSEGDAKALLKQHKIKVTWMNPASASMRPKRKPKAGSDRETVERPPVYPKPLQSFGELHERFAVAPRLVSNLENEGFVEPTEVQLGTLPILLTPANQLLPPGSSLHAMEGESVDLLTVAPTGSGKTLAFLIPLFDRIRKRKTVKHDEGRRTSAVILAPTKELVSQIVNEGRKLAKGVDIKVTQARKGMHLAKANTAAVQTGEVGGESRENDTVEPLVRADVLVSTPGLLHSLLTQDNGAESEMLSDVQDLVLDEADMLLDPLFREQTLGVWNRLRHPALRVSLWSATIGSNVEELTTATIAQRRERLLDDGTPDVLEAPLIRVVVGLKDSAVPNVEHRLVYAATEQGKLMGLRQLLHPAASSKDSAAPLLPPFLIFTQTIERAVALHSELLYDIPAEAGGMNRIAVLHSNLSDSARDTVMTRFRKGEIWVLITTDLLSRGIDFRGINGVVNYDIPTSSAAYVHRVGRTGRAGRTGGVAVTLYSKEDLPYLKHVANVASMAQKQRGKSADQGAMQQWLLDSLPKLSKQEKQKLKKRGVESRTKHGKEIDPKAARRARISSKAGFLRRTQNNRRGAVLGSQRRAQLEAGSASGTGDEIGEEAEFSGFD